jgi:glycerophosphoryl diester phosphodiesterase
MTRPARRILWALVLAALAAGAGYLFVYEPPYAGLVARPARTLVFAHRGFGNYAPDNSLAGAQMAMRSEMDGVDMDGQMSSDGVLVVFHDLSLDRLTSATGRVGSRTAKELLALDLGPKYGHGFKETFVATFEDFIRNVKGKGILMVELKVPGLKDTGIEAKAAALIRKYQAHESVYLSSFNPLVLYRLKKIDPEIRTVYIFIDTDWNPQLLAEMKPEDVVHLPWVLRQEPFRRALRKLIRPDLLSVNYQVAEDTVDTLLKAGQPIFLWTPETDAELRRALAKRPYGVISDEPQLAKKLRDGMGQP